VASKSIDDSVIENDDVDVSLVCRIRDYRYPTMMITENKILLKKLMIHAHYNNFNLNFEFARTQIFKLTELWKNAGIKTFIKEKSTSKYSKNSWMKNKAARIRLKLLIS